MSKGIALCLLVVATCFCDRVYARQEVIDEVEVPKTSDALHPMGPCGDNGNCFSYQHFEPGNITSIEYDCRGAVCDWTHPCPDHGKCHGLPDHKVEPASDGGTAVTWYGWSNSGNPDAKYIFRIHYQPKTAESAPVRLEAVISPRPKSPSGPQGSTAPNCGSVPCISVLGDQQNKSCGSHTAMVLVNHATKAATVKIQVTIQGNTTQMRVDNIEAAAGSSQFIGCSGSDYPLYRTSYTIVSVIWH